MMQERVMTDSKDLVRKELKNAGFDIDSMEVPKRVYLLAGGINPELNIGDVVLTEGAYNDTAVAGLYGFDNDYLETTPA